jgi:hypothetical protein
VTEAPTFSVVADVAIVKGETPAGDRTWLTFPDGTARRAAVHVTRDLPHLVIESVLGLPDGLWGTLAAEPSGPAAVPVLSSVGGTATRPVASGKARLRLVSQPSPADPGEPGEAGHPGRTVARAAVNAVLNRWGDGPDTPAGVRARLRRASPAAARLAEGLDDEDIRVAAAGVRRLYREWAGLPVGGTLRATWPLHDRWLRLL